VTAEKKDSQGLCFVGKISLPTFLQQQLKPKIGDIIEIPQYLPQFDAYNALEVCKENVIILSNPFEYSPDMGQKITTHQGAHYYTIGQRKGLHIGGRPEPSFVIGTDIETNTVFSGQTEQHAGLNRWALKIENKEVNWINLKYKINSGESLVCLFRIRYRQPLQAGTLYNIDGNLYILFAEKQRGITPGQFAAWYMDDELIGSGIILS
jgi:tRNA-specific 2-thiouridylase